MSKQLDMIKRTGAYISPCGSYRYRLWRKWGENPDRVVWIMLNPSTADALDDDPTIRRCTAFTRELGCEHMRVVNLFALRSVNPKMLRQVVDPIGPQNDRIITDECYDAYTKYVIAAWGNVAGIMKVRALDVIDLVRMCKIELYCLGTTINGHPRHPLYVPKNTVLQRWSELSRDGRHGDRHNRQG